MKKSEIKEGMTLRIRTEKTNDKSGKATPMDRILIIAPESANPSSLIEPNDVRWEQFYTPPITTLNDFS